MSQGECPCCKKENLEYGTVEFYDDQCYFPRECPDCGASGEEWYSMEFVCHDNVMEGDANCFEFELNDISLDVYKKLYSFKKKGRGEKSQS